MTLDRQSTVRSIVRADGVGLHSGEQVAISIAPAPADTGVIFQRVDLDADLARGPDASKITAHVANVTQTRLGTTITNQFGVSVATVEHLLSALAICGIDNAFVEIDGPEAPIMDGSAAPFVRLLDRAGCAILDAPRREAFVQKPVRVEDDERFIEIIPAEGRILEVAIDFPDRVIGRQSLTLSLDSPADRARLATARTFCRMAEVEDLRRAGFALGGSLENAVVVDGDKLLNRTGLRDPQEFVLHKSLDLVGDLALLGVRLNGRISAFKPGHDLNTRFVAALLADKDALAFRQSAGISREVLSA